MEIRVTLNGTDQNHWLRYNMKQNPFPQIARAELDQAMWQLNSLDGDPIQNDGDIRHRLEGWSEEFIQLCIDQFRPGHRITFYVKFPDPRATA